MADNVAITAGSGTTIAADDIAGALHQRVKVTWGVDGSAVDASATNPFPITITDAGEDVILAHDAADGTTGSFKVGHRAIAHGANPTAVAVNDRTDGLANRAGIPWVIGGHPNVIARSNRITDADGAQTDLAITGAIGAGTKVIVTQIWTKADKNNTGNVAVKIGFGTANVPTPASAGVAGLIFDEDLGAGEGHQIGNGSGIVAIGADGEELRLTCDDPAGGQLTVGYSYYTIES